MKMCFPGYNQNLYSGKNDECETNPNKHKRGILHSFILTRTIQNTIESMYSSKAQRSELLATIPCYMLTILPSIEILCFAPFETGGSSDSRKINIIFYWTFKIRTPKQPITVNIESSILYSIVCIASNMATLYQTKTVYKTASQYWTCLYIIQN